MGAGVAELDNDGFVDFYFGTGDPQLTRMEPNRSFWNNGDETFLDASAAGGFARPGTKEHGGCTIREIWRGTRFIGTWRGTRRTG